MGNGPGRGILFDRALSLGVGRRIRRWVFLPRPFAAAAAAARTLETTGDGTQPARPMARNALPRARAWAMLVGLASIVAVAVGKARLTRAGIWAGATYLLTWWLLHTWQPQVHRRRRRGAGGSGLGPRFLASASCFSTSANLRLRTVNPGCMSRPWRFWKRSDRVFRRWWLFFPANRQEQPLKTLAFAGHSSSGRQCVFPRRRRWRTSFSS